MVQNWFKLPQCETALTGAMVYPQKTFALCVQIASPIFNTEGVAIVKFILLRLFECHLDAAL